MSTASPAGPDLAAITQRQQKMWGAGDFAAIGGLHQIVSELLCEAVDLHAGQQVLDVACGSGNTAIAAARRICEVTGIDYEPTLLDRARERAAAERLPARFEQGDAAHLPYPDASFDVVLSTFGCMFSPDQAGTAAEMSRVCRPGGTIGMASWTPDSFPGAMFRIIAGYLPPAPGMPPPTRWGTEVELRVLFGDAIANLRTERRDFVMRYRSAQHWLE
jgi:SAM-dependent methyltransferase